MLHTYLVTSHAWADIEGRFARSASKPDVAALAEVRALLRRLIEQSADMLGIDRTTLDELRADRLVNREDLLRRWPALPREAVDVEGKTQQRLHLLRQLNDQVKRLGLDLGLGGAMPAHMAPPGGGLPR